MNNILLIDKSQKEEKDLTVTIAEMMELGNISQLESFNQILKKLIFNFKGEFL
jgi:hypothetical protein